MIASSRICVRVAAEIKAAFRTCAQKQQLTESALLKRLLDFAIHAGDTSSAVGALPSVRLPRTNRLSIRLTAEDKQRLCERANFRGLPAATYVSALVRTHLANCPPLPRAELRALMSALNAVNAIGRNLNQIARAGVQGAQQGERTLAAEVMRFVEGFSQARTEKEHIAHGLLERLRAIRAERESSRTR